MVKANSLVSQKSGKFIFRNQFFPAFAKQFKTHLRPLGTYHDSIFGAERFRLLKLSPDFSRLEPIVDRYCRLAQCICEPDRIWPSIFIGDNDKSPKAGPERFVDPYPCVIEFVQQVRKCHVSNRKAGCGQVCRAVANDRDQVVISTAPGESSVFLLAIKNFENKAGIVVEATDDGEIQLNKFLQTAPLQLLEQATETRDRFCRRRKKLANVIELEAESHELMRSNLFVVTFKFVDDQK